MKKVKEIIIISEEGLQELSDNNTLFFKGIKINVWGNAQRNKSITLLENTVKQLKDKIHRRNLQIKELKAKLNGNYCKHCKTINCCGDCQIDDLTKIVKEEDL